MIFDTHAHYYYREFRDDRDQLLRRLHEEDGVSAIVCVSENLETSQKSVALAQAYDFVYAAVGVHPKYAPQWRDSHYDLLRRMLSQPKVVAVGEMGLDYHRGGEDKALQEQVFVRQLELAQEAGLPVIIHDREAHGDTYRILRAYRPQGSPLFQRKCGADAGGGASGTVYRNGRFRDFFRGGASVRGSQSRTALSSRAGNRRALPDSDALPHGSQPPGTLRFFHDPGGGGMYRGGSGHGYRRAAVNH